MVPRMPEIDLIKDTNIGFVVITSWLLLKGNLLEFGDHLVHLVVGVGTGTAGVYRFSTKPASGSFLVEEGTLRGTGALKFAVF